MIREQIAQALEDIAHIIRGKQIRICGFCYHDLHKTEKQHEKKCGYHGFAGMTPLKVYEKDWVKAKDGRYSRK